MDVNASADASIAAAAPRSPSVRPWTWSAHLGDGLAPSVTEPEEAAVDVASWLRDLGLERYEATFRENDVGAELLPNLTADDLKEIGITSFRPSPATTGSDRRLAPRRHAGW